MKKGQDFGSIKKPGLKDSQAKQANTPRKRKDPFPKRATVVKGSKK